MFMTLKAVYNIAYLTGSDILNFECLVYTKIIVPWIGQTRLSLATHSKTTWSDSRITLRMISWDGTERGREIGRDRTREGPALLKFSAERRGEGENLGK